MKTSMAIVAALLLAGSAAAQAPLDENPPRSSVICLDVNGDTLPSACTVQDSRLDHREDICLCPAGRKITTPICPDGVRPPGENRAYVRARREAAKDGSLIGDLYEGRPMCVGRRSGG